LRIFILPILKVIMPPALLSLLKNLEYQFVRYFIQPLLQQVEIYHIYTKISLYFCQIQT